MTPYIPKTKPFQLKLLWSQSLVLSKLRLPPLGWADWKISSIATDFWLSLQQEKGWCKFIYSITTSVTSFSSAITVTSSSQLRSVGWGNLGQGSRSSWEVCKRAHLIQRWGSTTGLSKANDTTWKHRDGSSSYKRLLLQPKGFFLTSKCDCNLKADAFLHEIHPF